MSSIINLVCEACPIEGKVIPVKLRKENLKHSITGVSTVVDLHGLDPEAVSGNVQPHARILYVDERLTVRSFSVVTALAIRKEGSNVTANDITLVCEACNIEGRVIPVKLDKTSFKPSITGVSTVIDLHGIDELAKSNSVRQHVRILYVDERMSVRSYSVITALAGRK